MTVGQKKNGQAFPTPDAAAMQRILRYGMRSEVEAGTILVEHSSEGSLSSGE
jgi:hypothetical protein